MSYTQTAGNYCPGTKLQLVYSIAGEAETPNSVPQQNPTDQEV